MTEVNCATISQAALDEHWFSLRLKTWRAVKKAVEAAAIEQRHLAARIGMDPGQFSRILTGATPNVTLRTLHNIARAANHRLRITLEPLSGLPKPNYSYEAKKKEERERPALFEEITTDESDHGDVWDRAEQRVTA